MRLIGTLPSESDARRFGDYLVTLGMRNHVEGDARGAWQVWIEHDDHQEQATSQLHQYLADPNGPQYDAAGADARRVRREEATAAERRRRNFTDVRTHSFGAAGVGRTPITFALLAICLVVALLTQLGGRITPVGEALKFQPIAAVERVVEDAVREGDVPTIEKGHAATMFSSIAEGQVWRLVTPAVLHFGIIHLLFNLSWLMSIGRAVETRRGPLFFALFLVGAAIVSNCVEASWIVYGFGSPIGYASFGGLSGVVYALFGYAWLKGRLQPYEGLGVPQQTVGLMLGWLVVCMTGLVGPVANAAHVGGLAIGALVGAWPTIARKITAR